MPFEAIPDHLAHFSLTLSQHECAAFETMRQWLCMMASMIIPEACNNADGEITIILRSRCRQPFFLVAMHRGSGVHVAAASIVWGQGLAALQGLDH